MKNIIKLITGLLILVLIFQNTAVAAVSVTNDTQPPTAPTDLTASNKTYTSITLIWSKSIDNIEVKGYQLFRDGKKIITTSKTTFTNNELIPGRKYTYFLKAYDGAGNVSESSNPIEVSTISDIQVPSTPSQLVIISSEYTSIKLSWGASTDNTGIKGYLLYRNGKKELSTSGTSGIVKGLIPGTIYSFFVKALDIAGNYSLQSNGITGATMQDTSPPSKPFGLKVDNVTGTDLTLSWSPSSDNVKVKNYEVTCNSEEIGSTSKTYYSCKNMIPGSIYNFNVKASDNSGNKSPSSEPINVTMPKDLIKPTPPSELSLISIKGKSVKLKWNASTDNLKVKGYYVYCNGLEVSTTAKTTCSVKSPIDIGVDILWVKAFDLAGNISEGSNKITVIIA